MSRWFEIKGSNPHIIERVNEEKLLDMIKQAEKKENYERCATLLKIYQENEQKPKD